MAIIKELLNNSERININNVITENVITVRQKNRIILLDAIIFSNNTVFIVRFVDKKCESFFKYCRRGKRY
jgi:hypothetical protein